jgi:hypothetical protein
MNGFLERNLLALSGSNPDLAARSPRTPPDAGLSAAASRSGLPVRSCTGAGDYALHSRMDPLREAGAWPRRIPAGGFSCFWAWAPDTASVLS